MDAPGRFEATLAGLPRWLMRAYVESVGGQRAADGAVVGEGWQARITQVEDYQIGSLRVGRIHLELVGDPAAVERTRRALQPKMIRAGG